MPAPFGILSWSLSLLLPLCGKFNGFAFCTCLSLHIVYVWYFIVISRGSRTSLQETRGLGWVFTFVFSIVLAQCQADIQFKRRLEGNIPKR